MPNVEDLCQKLETHATELVKSSLDVLYENPIWEARFGARGRKVGKAGGH